MRSWLFVAWLVLVLGTAAQGQEPIKLNAGEVLVSVDGVQVGECRDGICPIRRAVKAVGHIGRAVGHGTVAYAHALREAQMMARANRYGHLLGVAPGCSSSGVGVSYSVDSPAHCYLNSGRVLVARAFCVGADGRVYWSAHYR